jgi:hypothetical protein
MATSLIGAVGRTAVRESFFVNWIIRAAEDVAVTQVVIVAEHPGAWARRVDWPPHVRVFRLHPDPAGATPALAAAGYDRGLPSAWLLESGTAAMLPTVARLTAFGSVIAAPTTDLDDPLVLFHRHGFAVRTADGDVAYGLRR